MVLAPSDRADVAGAAVSCGLRPARGRATVIALWDPSVRPSAATVTATAAARRSRERAASCGLDAQAAGRVVRVLLPSDDAQAVAAIERLVAVGDGDPVVVVLAGAWGAPFLPLLERSAVVRADGSPATVAACAGMLARHGIEVAPVPVPTGPVARMLLRCGWTGRAQVRRPAVGEHGQALLLVLLALLVALILAAALGAVASAMGGREERQRTVDLAALAAADRMRADWPARAGVPATISVARFRARAADAARRSATANGLDDVEVRFPDTTDDDAGPLTVRVRAAGSTTVAGVALSQSVAATAELGPPAVSLADAADGAEYHGRLARRDGKPMRPDVASAFDRMKAAAHRDGRTLVVVSGFRSNAEQARLFAANPNPRMVAPPGRSNHRLGIALDLGPSASYGWLAANGRRFGFTKPMSWEPWHWEYRPNPGSALEAGAPKRVGTGGTIPPWVPAAYRDTIRSASIRYSISAALLSAQLRQESGFDPRSVSSAGAEGIAQFMPGTAAAVGLRDPFDPRASIHAQARLMSGLLRRFGSVQLALAAYNAGEGAVARCNCIPPYPETRHYVAVIIAMMRGYDPSGGFADALAIRLVG